MSQKKNELQRLFSVSDHRISLRVLSKEHLIFLILLHKRFVSACSNHPSTYVTLIFEWTPGLQTSVRYHPEAFRVLGEQHGQTLLIIINLSA